MKIFKKRFALNPAEQEKECDHPQGFPYSGTVPNTGPQRCPLCGGVLLADGRVV